MATVESDTPKPTGGKLRWYQYRLRSLFVLTTLVAMGCGYFAYLYQRECEIAEQVMRLDPNAEIDWTPPDWIRKWGLEDRLHCFDRITMIDLRPDDDHVIEDDDIESLELMRLSSLQEFDAKSWCVSEEAVSFVNQHIIPKMNRRKIILIGNSRSMNPYPTFMLTQVKSLEIGEDPDSDLGDDAFEKELQLMLIVHWTADRLTENGYFGLKNVNGKFGCRRAYKRTEADILDSINKSCFGYNINALKVSLRKSTGKMPKRRLFAARALWRGKSRECAQEIIEYARNLKPRTDDERAFQQLVARDTSPERILSGLRGIRHDFSAWLAALEPRPEYVPELIRAAEEGRAANETFYALEHSTDDRAVEYLKNRKPMK